MFFGRKENPVATTTLFYRQMATMIASGVSMQDALTALGEENESHDVEHLIKSLSTDISTGETPGKSLKNYPDFVKNTLRYFIAADSKDTQFSKILSSIADDNEKMEALKKRVTTALVYPATIMSLAVVIMGVIMVFVIPTFIEIFSTLGGSIPAPTRLAISTSNFIVGNIVYIIALIGISGLVLKFNKTISHNLINIIPGIGALVKNLAIIRFLKYLSLLLTLNAPLEDAIDYASTSVNNVIYSKKFNTLKSNASSGSSLSDILSGTKLFSPMIIRMIKAGEKVEATDNILNEVAGYYEQKLDSIEKYVQIIDLAIMIFIGTFVGGLVISMYLPIFQIAGAVS